MAVQCSECGTLNAEGANFCQQCGHALAAQTHGVVRKLALHFSFSYEEV